MNDDAPAEAAANATPTTRRRWHTAFIALFLGWQVATPLAYYLGERGYDERFSWRMFSNVRMHECALALSETVQPEGGSAREQPIDAKRELHVAWFNILNRYRPAVVEKFLASRCDRPDVRAAHVERRCTDTDGTALPVQRADYDCAARTLHEERAEP